MCLEAKFCDEPRFLLICRICRSLFLACTFYWHKSLFFSSFPYLGEFLHELKEPGAPAAVEECWDGAGLSLGIVLCPRHCGGTLGWTLGFVTELAKPWGEVWEVSVVPNIMSRLFYHLPLSSCLDEAHSTEINCFIRAGCVQPVVRTGDAEVGSGYRTPSWVGTISMGSALGTVVALAEMGPWVPDTALRRSPSPHDSSVFSPQVATVGQVLGSGQQPAALGRQSRRSAGGDGGGGQQSGDLQGTGGRSLLGWGDLRIPGTAGNLQPFLLSQSSPSWVLICAVQPTGMCSLWLWLVSN